MSVPAGDRPRGSGARAGTLSRQRLNRNWNELLQEIRVTQTGVQILTGFLLTVPFSGRFDALSGFQRGAYLLVLGGSVATTMLVVAPVAFHRLLFRHRARAWLVAAADACARAGLAMMALTISGVVFLVFHIVAGAAAAGVAITVAVIGFAILWVGIPLASGQR